MEELKAMYPVCTLIKSDGTRCGSPAVTGTNFCFHHIGGRLPKSRTEIRPETAVQSTPLKFVYPDSYAAIQHNLFLVVQALDEGKIDNRTANTYNRLFRACELNLRKCEAANADIRLGKAPQEEPEEAPLEKDESVQQTDESLQQAADPEPEVEPNPEPEVDPGDGTADEAERRFREWQQSPPGQAFARMHSNLNGVRRSPDHIDGVYNAGTLG